jgi:hypothetical protein
MRAVRQRGNGLTRWLAGITACFAVYCGAAAWPARPGRAAGRPVSRRDDAAPIYRPVQGRPAAEPDADLPHLVKKPRTMPGLSRVVSD